MVGAGECDGGYFYCLQSTRGQGLDACVRDLGRLRRQRSGASEPAAEDKASAVASIAHSLLTGTFHRPAEAGDQKSRGTERQQRTAKNSPGAVASASLLLGSRSSVEE